MGLDLAILSGDAEEAVVAVAPDTGIAETHARLKPGDKLAWLDARRAERRKVLMVGDGLNDGPALAAAHASMSPAAAADVAKAAAGLVFTGAGLDAAPRRWRWPERRGRVRCRASPSPPSITPSRCRWRLSGWSRR